MSLVTGMFKKITSTIAKAGSSNGVAGKLLAEGTAQPKSTNSNSAPSDAVTLSKEAKVKSNPYSSIAKSSAQVRVDKWGTGKNDCLESILMNKGYTAEEIYSKGADGKSLLDRVVATNKLRNADLIQAGQNLVVPSKEEPKADKSTKSVGASADDVAVSGTPKSGSNGWNFEKNGGGFVADPNYSGSQSLARMKADFQKSDSSALAGLDAALRSLMGQSESAPTEAFVGPIAPSVGPTDSFIGPVDHTVGPAETFIGPVDHTVGPTETFIGPVNSHIAPDTPYFA